MRNYTNYRFSAKLVDLPARFFSWFRANASANWSPSNRTHPSISAMVGDRTGGRAGFDFSVP
jgi:hypothetical protein